MEIFDEFLRNSKAKIKDSLCYPVFVHNGYLSSRNYEEKCLSEESTMFLDGTFWNLFLFVRKILGGKSVYVDISGTISKNLVDGRSILGKQLKK